MLNPLHMVYICTMQHSNLQIECKFFLAFKVFVLLQVFCCCRFFTFVVLSKFCWFRSFFVATKVILVL